MSCLSYFIDSNTLQQPEWNQSLKTIIIIEISKKKSEEPYRSQADLIVRQDSPIKDIASQNQ